MKKLSLEYGHIYTDYNPDEKQFISFKIARDVLGKGNHNYSKVILIDDCSGNKTVEEFDLDGYLRILKENKLTPEVLVLESSLSKLCDKTLLLIENRGMLEDLRNYIESNGKYPCSLLIATWYLLRLGIFKNYPIKTILGSEEDLMSDKLFNILPKFLKSSEDRADAILESTKYKNLTKKIVRVYFDTRTSYKITESEEKICL